LRLELHPLGVGQVHALDLLLSAPIGNPKFDLL